MNREGRAILKKAAEKFNRDSMLARNSFLNVLEKLKSEEEEKLECLPEQLRDSEKGEQLEERLEALETLLDGIKEQEESISDLLSEQGFSFNFVPLEEKIEETKIREKSVSFHAIFPVTLSNALRTKAQNTGLSMNEVVCQALTKELCRESVWEEE